MASSLLALLDDIATVLDDVSTMTALAAKKTAGVIGDDLAVNAEQVTGVRAERELPVVWAVALGSLRNKAILVPLALAAEVWFPAVVTPLLMIGGLYLCFEGAEKIAHRLRHRTAAADPAMQRALADPAFDLVAWERDKVRGAVRTDFVLSAEIIVIALGTVTDEPLGRQIAVLVAIALAMTVGVYGLVAAIVKLDDAGLALLDRPTTVERGFGRILIGAAPRLMRLLTVVGTAAMLSVGGGILSHNWPWLNQGLTVLAGNWAQRLLADAAAGMAAGALVVAALALVQRLR